MDDVTHVVSFQASQWNTPEEAEFTIDLGAFFHESWTGTPFPKNPGSAAWLISQRIGHLMPVQLDRWWKSTPDEESVSREIARALEEHALPFLAQFRSKVSIRDYVLAGDRPDGVVLHAGICRAIVLVDSGRRDEAASLLQGLFDTGGDRNAAVGGVAQRLGVQLDSGKAR